MAVGSCIVALKFQACGIFGTGLGSSNVRPIHPANMVMKPLVIEARANARTENAKIRNRRIRKKFNGTATRPRLSVFCSDKQLYAMLVDDQNKKCLFYGSTLQKSIRKDSCTTIVSIPFDFLEVFYEKWRFEGKKIPEPRVQKFCSVDAVGIIYFVQEAAKLVGEELIKTCVDLNINEISFYDRNGFSRGEKMQAFEAAIGEHGFLPR